MKRIQANDQTNSASLSPEDMEAIKKTLSSRSTDLTQPPLEDLLRRYAQSREEQRRIHIGIALCAFTDCFAAVRNDEVQARENAFGRKLKPEENTGHYFYRFLRANCGFPAPKATKMSSYLVAQARAGLNPHDLNERMMRTWTLEDGYNDVVRARQAEKADDHDGDDESDGENSKTKAIRPKRSARSGGFNDDPPMRLNTEERPQSAKDSVEDDGDEECEQPESIRSRRRSRVAEAEDVSERSGYDDEPPPIELVGSRYSVGSERKSFAMVYYGVRGRPYKIKFLSPQKAKAQAERHLVVEHKTKRSRDAA